MLITSKDGNFIIEIDNRYFIKGKLPYQKRAIARIELLGQKRDISLESLADAIATCTIEGFRPDILPVVINRKRFSKIEIVLDSKFDYTARNFVINNYSHYCDVSAAICNESSFISAALSDAIPQKRKFWKK